MGQPRETDNFRAASPQATPTRILTPPASAGLPAPIRHALPTRAIPARPAPAVWIRHAPALADWVLARLKVRSDAHGAYRIKADGGREAYVEYSDLDRARLIAHFTASDANALVGVHPASPADTARYTVVDVDAHGPDADAEKNLAYAIHAHDKARAAGLGCRLMQSDGAGGYHLYLVYPEEVPVRDAWRLGKWLAADAPRFGLGGVESFPKSRTVLNSAQKLGNFVRLPGRHHTRSHWTRVWCPDGGVWLGGEDAIRSILGLEGSDTLPGEVVPANFLAEARRAPARRSLVGPPVAQLRDVALARSALGAIGEHYRDSYDEWVRIGMSLRGLGDDGLKLWHEWSAPSDRYEPDALDIRWDGFAPASGQGHAGLGTLFYLAEAEGWVRPDHVEFTSGEARISWSRTRITVGMQLGKPDDGEECR